MRVHRGERPGGSVVTDGRQRGRTDQGKRTARAGPRGVGQRRALEPLDRVRPGLLSVHHAFTVLRQQACKAEAAVAQLLPQSQPLPQSLTQSLPQPQSQPQPQPLSDAHARVAAQHAKAKQAQAEYERLQRHFAQLQQQGRVKVPPSVLELGCCASTGHSHRLWAIRYSQVREIGPLRSQSLPPN